MPVRFARSLVLILLAASAYPAGGQAPARLLADLAPGLGNSSSYPRQAVEAGGALYFVASRPLTGREVWRWDGSGPAQPLEVCPGSCSSNPQVLRPFGDRLAFVASGVGDEALAALWITDGGRPRRLNDMGVWTEGSRLAATSSRLYFTVRGEGGGLRLFSSDGTADGTAPVAGTESWKSVRGLTAMDDRLFVVVEDADGLDLWTLADGGFPTFLETVSTEFDPGWTEPFPQHDGTIWFSVRESRIIYPAEFRCALWSSDGTAAGTRRLTGVPVQGELGCGWMLEGAAFLDDGVLIFVAWRQRELEMNLWRSDGTDDGTFPVARAGLPLVAVGDRAFFGVGGYDTSWFSVTDGTVAGTHVSTDGDVQIDPSHPIAFEDGIVFAAYDRELGRAVWRTDGTIAGTRLVADVDPEVRPPLLEDLGDFPDFFNAPFAAYGTSLVFPAWEATHGEELWITDGTPEGTELAVDVNPGTGSSEPREITPVEGLPEATALLRAAGRIWRTAGDEVVPVTAAQDPAHQLFGLTPAAGTVFAENDAGELWSFEANDWSAEAVAAFDCPPAGAAELDGRLLFVALKDLRYFLYASDGTAGGTVPLAELPELVPLSGVPALPLPAPCPPISTVRLGGRLYVLAPHHLLTTAGTAGSTFDLLPALGCTWATCDFGEIAVLGGALYFTQAVDGATALWRGSGAVDDRSQLLLAEGPEGRIRDLTAVGDRLFFTRTQGTGETLWVSDGTAAGTRALRSFRAGVMELTDVAGRLFLSADDGVHGHELWTSDGTAQGTYLVADLAAGPEPSLPRSLREIDARLVFAADDGVHGHEVWTSDGTADGTRLVADIEADAASSPYGFTAVDDEVLFGAGTVAEGIELWALPREALAGPEEPPPPEEPPCPDETACLRDGQFTVTVRWRNQRLEGQEGVGHPLPFSDESSLFYFFSAGNVELIVKILDGRRQNGHFWVFYGGLSDVEYWITVTDTETSETRTYHNPPGEVCGGADTRAFAASRP